MRRRSAVARRVGGRVGSASGSAWCRRRRGGRRRPRCRSATRSCGDGVGLAPPCPGGVQGTPMRRTSPPRSPPGPAPGGGVGQSDRGARAPAGPCGSSRATSCRTVVEVPPRRRPRVRPAPRAGIEHRRLPIAGPGGRETRPPSGSRPQARGHRRAPWCPGRVLRDACGQSHLRDPVDDVPSRSTSRRPRRPLGAEAPAVERPAGRRAVETVSGWARTRRLLQAART